MTTVPRQGLSATARLRRWAARSAIMRRLDRGRSDTGGAALLEFAFVAPVLVLLFAGIIQFGMVLVLRSSMLDTAQDAARRMAVGEFSTQSEVADYVNSNMLTWAAPVVAATWPDEGAGETDVTVSVTVSMGEAVPFDLLGLFEGQTMPAIVTMRKEGL